MSNSVIFVWALAIYAIAVFTAVFALLRTRRENERLQERVRNLEARLRARPDYAEDDAPLSRSPGGVDE